MVFYPKGIKPLKAGEKLPFCEGDIVICLVGKGRLLEEGKQYLVKQVYLNSYEEYMVYVEGAHEGFYYNRFGAIRNNRELL